MALKIEDVREWVDNNKEQYLKALNRETSFPEKQLYQDFVELLDYYSVNHLCKEALKDLINTLQWPIEHPYTLLSNWVSTHTPLGAKKLLMFKIDYLDYSIEESDENHLLLQHHDLYIDRKAFRHLICFYDAFQILYWEMQLSIPENERVWSRLGDYYYTPPDPVPPIERLKAIVAKYLTLK